MNSIKAPAMGYFVSAENTQLLNVDRAELVAMPPQALKNAMQDGVTKNMDGLVGKIVSGYTWQFCGVTTIENSERFENQKTVRISFPGKMEQPLTASIVSVEKDAENGIAKFVLQCDYVNADVLKLGKETARIDFATYTGLRVNADAVRYVREKPNTADSEQQTAETTGENYVPGVYVKYGNGNIDEEATVKIKDIPADIVTASGSGLDPNISVQAAKLQITAISEASGLTEEQLTKL